MNNFFETRIGMGLVTVCLGLLACGGVIWFAVHFTQLTAGVVQGDAVIDFDKGAMYLLGCGIILLALFADIAPKIFFREQLPDAVLDKIGNILWIGFLAAVLLPHLIHFSIWTTLKSRDYVVCQDLGSRWLMHVTFVYANSPEQCLEEMMTRR